MKMIAAVAAIAGMLAFAPQSRADWISHTQEDPFRGNETLAVTSDGAFTLGFACTKASDLMMIFVVPEKHQERHADFLNAAFRILVIVDDMPKVELVARAQVVPKNGWYRFVSDVGAVTGVVHAVATAKRRVAVAVEFMGELGHTKQFSVSGSGRALGKLTSGCKLPPR